MNVFKKKLMLLMLTAAVFVISGCIPFLHGGHGGGHSGRFVESKSSVSLDNNENSLIVQRVNNRE